MLDNKGYLDVKILLVSYFSFYNNSKENITFFQAKTFLTNALSESVIE